MTWLELTTAEYDPSHTRQGLFTQYLTPTSVNLPLKHSQLLELAFHPLNGWMITLVLFLFFIRVAKSIFSD